MNTIAIVNRCSQIIQQNPCSVFAVRKMATLGREEVWGWGDRLVTLSAEYVALVVGEPFYVAPRGRGLTVRTHYSYAGAPSYAWGSSAAREAHQDPQCFSARPARAD